MSWGLWFVYYPLLRLIGLFIFWLPEIQSRKKFEKKNAKEVLCSSFHELGLKADLCFEFSSEGEYQQVASLIDDGLKLGKKIELVFFSPSVEKTIVALAQKFPDQLRYLRYPLVNFSLWKKGACFSRWVTSKKLILVRYDFFPEFFFWANSKGNFLSILWVTFKKERVNNKNISWAKKMFFSKASQIVYASTSDQDWGKQVGLWGPCYDFRMEQIKRRLSVRDSKFSSTFSQYENLRRVWGKYPIEKRLIIGNSWPSDLFLFDQLPEDCFVLIVPHQLSPEVISSLEHSFIKIGREPLVVTDETKFISGDTIILNKKGVLCELYKDFGFAYVGGGFEVGVHSILEPLVAGVGAIACGPLNHRSTEFDQAMSLGQMSVVNDATSVLNWLNERHIQTGPDRLSNVFDQYEKFSKEVISC